MFPIIQHINDVIPFIKDKQEILVTDKGEYTVICYAVAMENTFDNDYARECRGIKFSSKTGEVISRGFHKFFNLNQIEETQEHMIAKRLDKPHYIQKKMDGSLITTIPMNGSFRLGTKAGITDVSLQAENFIEGKDNYIEFIKYCIKCNWTPCFEWVSQKQRIVVDYPEDNLILLAIRGNGTGHYFQLNDLTDIARNYNIPLVETIEPMKDIKEFKEYIRTLEGEEGVVVVFEDGYRIKIKGDWYCLRHHSRDLITQEYKVVQMILNEEIDDLIPMILEDDIKKVHDLENFIEKMIEEVSDQLNYIFLYVGKTFNTKKDFALSSYSKDLPSDMKSAMFSLMDGNKSCRELAIETIRRYTSKDSDWKSYKEMYYR